MDERETGRILAGIDNLNNRYATQERKFEAIEQNISNLYAAFIGQPAKCLKAMEDKFVTKERIEPLENMHATIKKTAIILFCTLVSCLAIVLTFIKEHL